MIDRALRTIAIVASLIVALGFVLFAVDEFTGASRQQQTVLDDPDASPQPAAPRHHPGLRGTIEDADDALLRPFSGLAPPGSRWAERGIPTLLALLVYGVGLGFLARYVRSRA